MHRCEILFFSILFCLLLASGFEEVEVETSLHLPPSMSGNVADIFSLFLKNLQRSPSSSGTLNMATVEGGKPRVRTVLFQGLVSKEDGAVGLSIKTSSSSRKYKERDSDQTEFMFWLPETMAQFRFAGNIEYGDPQERSRVWLDLNPAARSQFFYDPDDGLDTSTSGAAFRKEEWAVRKRGLDNPPDNFEVGVLFPNEIDFLNLQSLERQNWQRQGGEWTKFSGYAPPVVSTVY